MPPGRGGRQKIDVDLKRIDRCNLRKVYQIGNKRRF